MVRSDCQVFCPITGQAVLPSGEVSGEEQLIRSDDEDLAETRLYEPLPHTAGRASAQ